VWSKVQSAFPKDKKHFFWIISKEISGAKFLRLNNVDFAHFGIFEAKFIRRLFQLKFGYVPRSEFTTPEPKVKPENKCTPLSKVIFFFILIV
jgi:hypothetical protein